MVAGDDAQGCASVANVGCVGATRIDNFVGNEIIRHIPVAHLSDHHAAHDVQILFHTDL